MLLSILGLPNFLAYFILIAIISFILVSWWNQDDDNDKKEGEDFSPEEKYRQEVLKNFHKQQEDWKKRVYSKPFKISQTKKITNARFKMQKYWQSVPIFSNSFHSIGFRYINHLKAKIS